MKRALAVIALALFIPSIALAQAERVVVQGKTSTGKLVDIVLDPSGQVKTSSSGKVMTNDTRSIAVSTASACIGPTGSGCVSIVTEADSCWRVSCNVDVSVRSVASGDAMVATTTDMDLYARTVEPFCLNASYAALAFITSSGAGTCKLTKISK